MTKSKKNQENQEKYLPQKKWQEKNGYVSKSYRLDDDIKDIITTLSKEKELSYTKVLSEALSVYSEKSEDETYKEDFATFYTKAVARNRVSFKMKQEFADKITHLCDINGYNQGRFISTLVKLYSRKK